MAEVLGEEGQALKVRMRPEQLLLLFTRQRWTERGCWELGWGRG